MDKLLNSLFFFVAIVLLIYVLFVCIYKKSEMKKNYIVIVIIAILINVSYLFYILSDNSAVMRSGIILVYMLIDWLLYFLLSFILKYSGVKLDKKIILSQIICVVISNVLFFISFFKEFAFVFNDYYHADDADHLFKIDHRWPYYIHLCIDYLFILMGLITLTYKFIKVPRVYKVKYWTLIVVIVAIVLVNFVLTLINFEIDYTILLFALASVLVEHFCINYNLSKLNKKIKYLLIDGMNDGLVIFDVNDKFFYANNKAINLFGIGLMHEKREEFINKYKDIIDSKETVCYYTKGVRLYLETDDQEFKDKKGKIEAYAYIFYDVTAREEQYNQRKYYENHDELTDSYNRSYFNELALDLLKSKPDTKYYVMAINYLEFRLINDYFGIESGDFVLKTTADILKGLLDKYDFLYGRMGSDKFAILANSKLVEEEKLPDIIYSAIISDERLSQYSINANIGVCEVLNNEVAKAYEKAIMSLHYIKGDYEKKIAYYDELIDDKYLRQHQILNSLDKALSNHEFEIYLQPQINSYDDSLIGAEALVRWTKSEMGVIYPAEFIPLFEKKNVIYKVDLYVWEEACKFLGNYIEGENTKLSISINVSPVDFYHLDVCNTLVLLTKKYGIAHSRLKVEITESAFILDKKLMIEKTEELKQHGFIVEMDDFGSGYSTFNMLKDIPIDIIKLDLGFLRGNIDDYKSYEIINSIVGMSHRLSIPVIAEGVETKEQLDMLSRINCDLIQGYYYSKPIPLGEFKEFMKKRVVSEFIEFWVSNKESKELFSTFKDIQKSYNNTPLSICIIGPNYTQSKLEELVIYYISPSFSLNLNLNPKEIRLSPIENIFEHFTKDVKYNLLNLLKSSESSYKFSVILKNKNKVDALSYLVKDKFIALVLYI